MSRQAKVQTWEKLQATVAEWRARGGRRLSHVHGAFDLVDDAQVERLRAARAEGQLLVVTVAERPESGADPLLDLDLRVQTLASLPFVDWVAPVGTTNLADCLRLLQAEHALFDLDRAPPGRPAKAPLTPAAQGFLRQFRQRYRSSDIAAKLQALKNLRVLVVGDAIVDEYHFCRPYGMPQKSPVIASQFLAGESYAGGALAVANHVAGFCREVELVTCLGEQDSKEQFVRDSLAANVRPRLLYRPDAPTTVKRRYLRQFLVQKLFEISFFNDSPIPVQTDAALRTHLAEVVAGYDLVIAADFGQGFLTRGAIELLCEKSRFLAVNTQLNSVNFGYHVVTKYPRADYVCLDEEEIRMACRDKVRPLGELLEFLAAQLGCSLITVTRGHHGSLTVKPSAEQVEVPVFSSEVVDTIGAGDAYLSVAAPCAALGFPPELIGFIGNAVGAVAVRILGNQRPVAPEALFEQVELLLR